MRESPQPSLVSLAVLSLCAVLIGCGSGNDTKKTDAKASKAQTPGQREGAAGIKTATAATVAITAFDGDYHSHGSGVIIDAERGLVLTAGHVVDQAQSLSVVIGQKTKAKGRVVARAQCKDVALIALYPAQHGLVALPYANSDALAEGDRVITVGYAGLVASGEDYERAVSTEGRVSVTAVTAELTDLLPPLPNLIAHQAPVAKSSSGGPLLDESGRFVGLNLAITGPEASEGPPGLFYALPSNSLKQLMAELQPGEQSFFAGWEKYHRCHRDMARLARSVEVLDHDLPRGHRPMRAAEGGPSGGGGHHHGG